MGYIWPEIFKTPPESAEKYRPELEPDTRRLMALSDQHSGWGLCMAGAEIPEQFGVGMALLRQITGAGTPEECLALSKELIPDP